MTGDAFIIYMLMKNEKGQEVILTWSIIQKKKSKDLESLADYGGMELEYPENTSYGHVNMPKLPMGKRSKGAALTMDQEVLLNPLMSSYPMGARTC